MGRPRIKKSKRFSSIKQKNKSRLIYANNLRPLFEELDQKFTKLNTIAEILNEKGITTVRGRPWTMQSVSKYLHFLQFHKAAHGKKTAPIQNRALLS